jgi:acyl carrier protein
MNSLDKLKQAFITALALPSGAEAERAVYGETAGWDSVAHMALVAEIEAAFDVMLDTEEVIDMSSFSKAEEILSRHGVAVRAA